MPILQEFKDEDFWFEKSKVITWNKRNAARAIVINDKWEIAYLHVSKWDYYKIPGGGVEEDEDLHLVLAREVLEEAWVEVEFIQDIWIIKEIRSQYGLDHTSYCFLTKVTAIKETQFTQKEIENGFAIHRAPIDKVIELMRSAPATKYSAKFMQARDLLFVQKAKDIIKSIR